MSKQQQRRTAAASGHVTRAEFLARMSAGKARAAALRAAAPTATATTAPKGPRTVKSGPKGRTFCPVAGCPKGIGGIGADGTPFRGYRFADSMAKYHTPSHGSPKVTRTAPIAAPAVAATPTTLTAEAKLRLVTETLAKLVAALA